MLSDSSRSNKMIGTRHEHWCDFIKQGRNRQDRPIGNNTRVILLEDGNIGIKLHRTVIITIEPDDSFTLNTGGWSTVTTKARMNDHMPHGRIWQEKNIWYFKGVGKEVAYEDGMHIDTDGKITGEGEDPQAKLKLDRQIKQYCRDYMEEFQAGNIPRPGNADCFYCRGMFGDDRNDGHAHMLSHMEEKYYVPSLLLGATQHRCALMSPAAKEWMAYVWSGEYSVPEGDKHWAKNIVDEQIRKTLQRYMRMCLGLAC